MTAEPRDVEEIRADMAVTSTGGGFVTTLGGTKAETYRLARDVAPLLEALAVADRENAELRGEVERHEVFMRAIKDCRDDPARAIAQNDIINGKAIIAAHIAEAERDDLRAQLAAAQAQLAEARENLRREQDALATLYGGFAAAAEARDHAEAQVLIQNGYTNRAATAAGVEQQRAEAAEARLEAVRARAVAIMSSWSPGDPAYKAAQELYALALSAAPQPEPDAVVGYSLWLDRESWGHVIDGLIRERADAMSRKAANSESTSDGRAGDIADVIAKVSAADPLRQFEPPASDEPARCDCTCDRAKEGAAFHHPTCPSYISDEPARYCRVCGAPMSLHLDPPCRPAASGTPDGGA